MKVTYDDTDFRELQKDYHDAVNKLLDVTEDRDRLREALKTYATNDYDFDDDCSGGESGQIARDALAPKK